MKNTYTRDDIVKLVKEEDVEFIRLQFTDMFGNLKNIAVTANQLHKALDNKCVHIGDFSLEAPAGEGGQNDMRYLPAGRHAF